MNPYYCSTGIYNSISPRDFMSHGGHGSGSSGFLPPQQFYTGGWTTGGGMVVSPYGGWTSGGFLPYGSWTSSSGFPYGGWGSVGYYPPYGGWSING